MEPTADEIAGVVDLFGALAREDLRQALSELAFKRGTEIDDADDLIDHAVASYHLVTVEQDGDELLAVGPTAFPELPEGAGDLPHILDAPERELESETLGAAVEERFREEAAAAVKDGDEAAIADLLDLSYELEAWGPVDLDSARERLDAALG